MRKIMVIPTYWSRKKNDPWQEGDAVYDHPTPLDGEDTLKRTLESVKTLSNKDFKLVIPVCPTSEDIEHEANNRVRQIIEDVGFNDIDTYIFTMSDLQRVKMILNKNGISNDDLDLLSIKGYPNVRNICLLVSHILAGDVSILIDDDEIFENKEYVTMATEFIGKRIYGKNIYGVAGYYLNKFDEFYDDVDIVPWMTYWNRFGFKTKAFDKIIASEPRLKVTPFAFGGAMVMHKNLYKIVPFDPNITRGEDIDYLINSKMFGFDFFLDNKLNIKHLPPKKSHPVWKRFREDIHRFLYQRAKINNQHECENMTNVTAEDFEPYPGEFLKDDLEDKIYKTNVLLGLDYLSQGNIRGCQESLKNVYISEYEAVDGDPFQVFKSNQEKWVNVIKGISKNRMLVRQVMEENNQTKLISKTIKISGLSKEEIKSKMLSFEDFENFTDYEMDVLSNITHVRCFEKEEKLFQVDEKELRFYMVLSGCIRIVKYNQKGEEIHLSDICSGGVIGESFMTKEKYNSTAIANEYVEVLSMKKSDLNVLMKNNPNIGNKLLTLFLNRLYYKLHLANKKYREKLMSEENLEQ